MATDFVNLQNGFYNGICNGLGLSNGTFQILQPSPPLVGGSGADNRLWSYFNNIPPATLTQQYISSGGNQYFSDYTGLISALQAPPNTFQQDIGTNVYNDWIKYLGSLTTLPAPTQLPSMFLYWAMVYAPAVANIGAADLSAMLLNPISAAGLALMPYTPIPGVTPPAPDWSVGYKTLVKQLKAAPAQNFTLDSNSFNYNVSSAWTQSENSGLFGLWGGSSYQSSESKQFASSHITIVASFAHVFTFQSSPGAWYNSSAMGTAYSHQSGSPWKSGSPITWQTTFDPANGNMARFLVSLIVVDTMNIQVTSDATFSQQDQTTIRNNSSAGLWPFYTNGGSSGSNTNVGFNNQGHMTVTITSQSGVPVVLGGNVLPVAQYLGHAVEGARIFAKQSEHNGAVHAEHAGQAHKY